MLRMTADHEQRAGQTPYQRLEAHFNALPQTSEDSTSRTRRLDDGTELWIGIDRSDEYEKSFGVSVVTRPEREKATISHKPPEFFGFTISPSGEHDYVKIPRPRLRIGDIELERPLDLNRISLHLSNPLASRELVDWLDQMIDGNRHILPPFQVEFPQELMEPNA
jgi:hypothetical protein